VQRDPVSEALVQREDLDGRVRAVLAALDAHALRAHVVVLGVPVLLDLRSTRKHARTHARTHAHAEAPRRDEAGG
jgi:hypothetical protein